MTAAAIGDGTPGVLSLGPWLKQRRRVLDMTQDQLAQSSTCSLATIRKIEAGDLLPSKQLAQQIAGALGIAESDHAAFVAFARAERAAVQATAFSVPLIQSERFAPLTAETAARRYRVPAQLTPLIGREWEIQASCALLRRPVARLLTLTGPPGSGKTRLALAVAEELQAEFAGGALFVPLAPVSDPSLVTSHIAQAMGIRFDAAQPSVERIVEQLGDQQLLLVLDNFEQVTSAAPLLAELLMASPGLKILVTSRSLLRLYGEHEFPVPPLPLPDPDDVLSVEDLLLYPAIDLFVQRAQAVQPTFALSEENARAILEICAWVEGLPLAIEMAAAQIKWYSPQSLLGQLTNRLSALDSGPRYLAPRQQTLRGAIEWSYNLLTDEESRLFDSLAVFVGGCNLDAVAAVHGNSNQLAVRLQSLVDHSMLQQQQLKPDPWMPARFLMLETIREYAGERLAAQGRVLSAQRAHAVYFFQMAQNATTHLDGEGQEEWLKRLEADEANLRAALSWCRTNDLIMGLQLATALSEYWYMRGNLNEGRSHLAALLRLDHASTPALVRADALHAVGYLAFRQGDHLDAEPILAESLTLYRSLDYQSGVATTLHHLGIAAFHQNRYSAAQALYEQSLAAYQSLGQSKQTAVVLKDLGLVAKDRGELDRAMDYFEQSLALQRIANNKHGIARCQTSMSIAAYWQGDFRHAAYLAWQALAIQRDIGDKIGIAYTLENLGASLYKMGEITVATQQMEECLELFRTTGDKMGVVLALDNLGVFARTVGNRAEAIRYHRESLAVAWQIREMRRMAFCFEGLAAAEGLNERAVHLFAAADALRKTIGAPVLPSDRAEYEATLSDLVQYLGQDRYESAWKIGASRQVEEAFNYAFEGQ